MKSVAKPLSIISIILYVAGIITVAIYLYKLPDSLIGQSSVLHMDNITEIQAALNQTILVISLALTIGLITIIMQLFQTKSANSSIAHTVFLEKFKADLAEIQQEQSADGQYDNSSLSRDIIKQIQAVSASQEEPEKILETALRTVCKQLEACQGAVYVAAYHKQARFIEMCASFAYIKPDSHNVRYEFGEGLPGQVAKEGVGSIINSVPDGYIKIFSGLGQASPKHLILVPVKAADKVVGLVEIASFTSFSKKHQEITQQAFSMLTKHFEACSSLVNTLSEAEALEEFEDNHNQ